MNLLVMSSAELFRGSVADPGRFWLINGDGVFLSPGFLGMLMLFDAFRTYLVIPWATAANTTPVASMYPFLCTFVVPFGYLLYVPFLRLETLKKNA